MSKRLFDIFFSFIGLLLLTPLFFIVSLWILMDSKGGIFFSQIRIGKNKREFALLKFRTMRADAESKGQLTVGSRDPRITNSGYFLRKYKVDELPQLMNVLMGDMSLVGPRPEVKKYVDMYTEIEQKILSIKPGITDYASIEYSNENDLLASSANPEELYIKEIMPAKLKLNAIYLEKMGMLTDVKIIWMTLKKIAP